MEQFQEYYSLSNSLSGDCIAMEPREEINMHSQNVRLRSTVTTARDAHKPRCKQDLLNTVSSLLLRNHNCLV